MSSKPLSTALIGILVAGLTACGGEVAPEPPPYPTPKGPQVSPTTQCPAECPSSCDLSGRCITATQQCPAECPGDCDSFRQCNYQLDPEARYRVDLLQASVTQSGSRACSLTGMLGLGRASCDLYVIFRTRTHELRSDTQWQSSVVYGGLTVPDITLADLEQYFEVWVMDENNGASDMKIASCSPDLTKEALEVGTVAMQCGVGFGGSDDEYAGSSRAVVTLRLTALDGGAVRQGNQQGGTSNY